jgi:uncharacterized protein (DUF1501 family)
MASSRRIFLRNSAMAMVGVGAAPVWLERALYAKGDPAAMRAGDGKKILVAIFQRGAADGLNIVVPHGDPEYYAMRPSIGIPRPGQGVSKEDSVVDLDGHFGLHPMLAGLRPMWDARHLAIVQAVGSPDPTRSHFDAQDYMESGTPGLKATNDGWLNRALPPAAGKVSPIRAVALGPNLPRSLRGDNSAIAVDSVSSFQVKDAGASAILQSLYSGSHDEVLNGTGRETFEAMSILQNLQKQPYQPSAGANYPKGRFADNMRQIAQLIKANVGVEVAFADIGGWDHHVNEVGATASKGPLANLLNEFGETLAAFYRDLGDRMGDVVVATMSEFGRTARENGNRGTDHGHANCMFVMGGDIAGGKVFGKWPGLAKEQLYEGRDLDLTTDFRAVLGELVSNHLGNRNLKAVFPNYDGTARDFRGLLRA